MYYGLVTKAKPPRPCPRGCGNFLAMRETKSCAACRAADRVRPCLFCGAQLGERQSKCCGATACKEAYRIEKQAKAAVRTRERYATEPEYRDARLSMNSAWRERDPAAWRESQKKYYEANREKRIAQASAHATARRAHKKASMVIPFTAEQLRHRLSMYHGCWICGRDSWDEVDHVKPIAKGGPHILANLRPACRDCNRRKSATWPIPTTRKAQSNGDLRGIAVRPN